MGKAAQRDKEFDHLNALCKHLAQRVALLEQLLSSKVEAATEPFVVQEVEPNLVQSSAEAQSNGANPGPDVEMKGDKSPSIVFSSQDDDCDDIIDIEAEQAEIDKEEARLAVLKSRLQENDEKQRQGKAEEECAQKFAKQIKDAGGLTLGALRVKCKSGAVSWETLSMY